MAPSLTSFWRHNWDISSISCCSSKNLIMWAKTWQKHCNNAASYFARPGRMCTQLLDVLLVEAFCSLQRTLVERLNSSGFSSIFHPTLELANVYVASRDNVFLLIADKNNNQTLKAFNKTRFRCQFVPPVNIHILSKLSSERGESGLRGIQASLPGSTVQPSVHQVISDNRRLGTRARGHRGRGDTWTMDTLYQVTWTT